MSVDTAPAILHNVTGIVQLFNASDATGYIISDYGDLLLKPGNMQFDPAHLGKGQLVRCNVCIDDEGLYAVNVSAVGDEYIQSGLRPSTSRIVDEDDEEETRSIRMSVASRRNSTRIIRNGRRIYNVSYGPDAYRLNLTGRTIRVFNADPRSSTRRSFRNGRRVYSVSTDSTDERNPNVVSGAHLLLERLRNVFNRFHNTTESDSDTDDERQPQITTSGVYQTPTIYCSGKRTGSGFDTSRFLEDVPNDLICTICYGVLNNPLLTACEHLFCRYCIIKWLAERSVCPMDRERLRIPQDLKTPPRFLFNMLNSLRLHCEFEDFGCPAIVPLGELESHTNSCPFQNEEIDSV